MASTLEATTVNRRYRVERRLGEGGMAEVYLAHDLLLNRPVAIKNLHARYASDAAVRARFEREAQRAGSLTHPNIIEVYDVGEEDDRPYIVMEYVGGDTLKNVIRNEGPFEPDDVAALLEQVASALDYAHERGVVHRDVKPQNILVDEAGLAKVVDFGIAKSVTDASLTDLGTALGTAHYVSPEQASGLMVTPASDIYSLGVVAFEMLTRHVPFDSDSSIGIAIQHIEDPPPLPSAYQPSLAPSVDDIVLRAMAKNPTVRYQTAGGLAAAMSNWQHVRELAQAEPAGERSHPAAATAVLSTVGESKPRRDFPADLPSASNSESHGQRDAIGRGTWFVGAAVVATLIALVVFGASLSQGRLGTSGDARPTATVTPAPNATDAPSQGSRPGPGVTDLAVPAVTGMDPTSAAETLTNLGLLVREGDAVYSRQVGAGDIAEQDPPAGAATAPGRSVVLKRSLGSPEIDLAALNLVGRPVDEARALAEERGLNVVVEETRVNSAGAGTVIRVDPESTATVGDTVTLVVNGTP